MDRMRVFLFDAVMGRTIPASEAIEMECSEILLEWDGLSNAPGTFLGVVNSPSPAIQFMWEQSDRILIDIPLPEKGGSLWKHLNPVECRLLITRICDGEDPLSIEGLRFAYWQQS